MMQRAIGVVALALLLLLGGLILVVLQRDRSAAREAAGPPPPVQAIDLGAELGLESMKDCSRSTRLASLFEQMVRVDQTTFESRRGGPIAVPGYERPLVPTFERTRETGANRDIREVTADLDLPGRWHGLAIAGLRRSFYEESDVSTVSIRLPNRPTAFARRSSATASACPRWAKCAKWAKIPISRSRSASSGWTTGRR